MSYQTTITKKGQLTLPKKVREALGLRTGDRVVLEPDPAHKKIKITPLPSLEKLAGSFRVTSSRNPVEIRKEMEKTYTRV